MFKLPSSTPLPHNNRISIETATTTTITISPPFDDAIVHPPPPSPPRDEAHNTTLKEIALQTSLQNLEHQIISYQNHCASESTTTTTRASEQDEVENVALAIENITNQYHPNPKAKSHWKTKANKFRRADSKKRDGVLKSITKGFMIVLMAPFYILGATLWAIGTVFGRFGLLAFEGVGRLTKKVNSR